MATNAAGTEIIKKRDNKGDTIEFSGYEWMTKESFGKHAGPGNNFFSGSKENVYIDSDGNLRLRITNRNDKWYCPEVRLMQSLGYGRYYFHLAPLPQPLDKDVVIGMFLYDRDDTSNFHKEIDIEFSHWGKDSAMNSQFVIQPHEDEAYRYYTDFTKSTKHLIEVRRKKIHFRSYYESETVENKLIEYSKTTVKPEYQYRSENEKVSINVWLYHTVEPSNLQEFEVIITGFEYKPFWYDKILNK
jgi:hypothetical protein